MISILNDNELTSEAALKDTEQYIPGRLPGGVFIYNAKDDERILYVEDNVIKLFGCETVEEFREHTGNSFKGMVHPDDLEAVEESIQQQTMYGEKRHDYVRYRIITKQGETRYVEDFGHLMHGDNGRSYFYVFIIDLDKDEYFNREHNGSSNAELLSVRNELDPLTGLFNMGQFYRTMQEKIEDPSTRRPGLSFLYYDISNFKLFNERYGFRKGDELLSSIAGQLRENFIDAVIARFSDDHFAVATWEDDVEERLKRVHNAVYEIQEGAKVNLCAGIYRMEESCTDVGLACDHARLACNTSKATHDRYFFVYDAELRNRLRKQQYIIDHIDEAVLNNYLRVFYQPVIRVSSGEICGYEALARWDDPIYGMLAPYEFIQTLEEFHLIHKLDTWMIKKICEDLRILLNLGEPVVPVSLNLSRLDFELCDIYDIVEDYRKLYDLPKNLLDIEITESALSDNAEDLKRQIEHFYEEGYSIWIDDFGSGYSSLNTLVEYPFDVLKLDMVFLRSFDNNPKTGELLKHIIEAANEMGIQTLHEGVETETHFDFLKSVGCGRAQGYFFGKPQPLEESRAMTRSKGLVWESRKE